MPTTITIDGDLASATADETVERIDAVEAGAGPLTLQLGDAEIVDGRACAIVADAIRRAATRLGDVVVVEAPQPLAHTLYRLGSLGSGAIQLIEPRQELGSSS